MNFLTNPLVLRMGLIFVGIASSFLIAVLLMRRMRRSLSEESAFGAEAPASEGSPLYAVIQQLKQQKHELQTERQARRRRAKTSENISAAVLSHLSSGVMFLSPGRTGAAANAAAGKFSALLRRSELPQRKYSARRLPGRSSGRRWDKSRGSDPDRVCGRRRLYGKSMRNM